MNPANAVTRLVPFAHVAEIERSLEFYSHLGFQVHSSHTGNDGRRVWATIESHDARLMLALSNGEIAADQQGVLFYMYCDAVERLREYLVAVGVQDGGRYTGQSGKNSGCHHVFDVAHPFYMPAGELRVHDPDGYVLLIGQLA